MEYDQLNYQEVQAFDVRVIYRRVPLHIHNVNELFFCYAGDGAQLAVRGIEPMRPGDLFCFPAGDPHRGSGGENADCIGAVINFGDDLCANPDIQDALRLLRRWCGEHHHRIPLSPAGAAQVETSFRAAVEENRTRRRGHRAALQLAIEQILLTVLREAAFPADWQEKPRPDLATRIEYARQYLEKNCLRRIGVEEVCREVGLSRSHFHAGFLRFTGATMTEYLNRKRALLAAKMLREGGAEPEAIARYCGFGSMASFYRVLRRETGLTPGGLQPRP